MSKKQEQPELSHYAPESKELEALLGVGYDMDREQAETIIKERKENPALWPYEEYKKAVAFLAALTIVPTP